MKQLRELGAILVLAAAIFSPAVIAAQTPSQPQGGLPDLVGALKATPGVLGVDAGQMISGKQVIFAWFENKKAALAWFHSPTHQQLMKLISPDYKTQEKPMADVPDDGGPILAIASITLTGPQTPENPLPFKQIAIELYRPLTGGLSIGGSFAPEGMKVPQRGSDRPAKK